MNEKLRKKSRGHTFKITHILVANCFWSTKLDIKVKLRHSTLTLCSVVKKIFEYSSAGILMKTLEMNEKNEKTSGILRLLISQLLIALECQT